MKKVFIQGVDITDDIIDGLEEFSIELGLNTKTKTIGKVLSIDLVVEGFAAKKLHQYFFFDCDSWQRTLPALFTTDICGGISIECEITSEGIEWNPALEQMTFNLKSGDEISRAYARLDSEYIFGQGFIEKNETPIMFYVDEPNWMLYALLLLTQVIRIVLNTIERVINGICEVVTLTFGECDVNITGLVFSKFDTWISGTGRWSVCPLIREIIDYQCTNVGLKFVSSILNDPSSPYYNTSIFCLTGGENGDYKDTSRLRVQEIFTLNSPFYTTTGLLDKLNEVFNADYRIIGDTLYFERIDFFDNIRNVLMLDTKDHCLTDGIKISYNTNDAAAYGEYTYTQDAYDNGANMLMKPTYNYQEKLEFNVPYNPAQKVKKSRNIGFGASRFMFDEVSLRNKSFFNFGKFMDDFRDGPENVIEDFFIGNEGQKATNDLKLSSSSLSLEKLLILEPNFNRKDAKVIKHKIKGKYYSYNRPLHLDEDGDYNELTKNFLYLDNPRLKKDLYSVSEFSIECDCNAVNLALDKFQETYVLDKDAGKIISEKIILNFKEDKVTIDFSNNRALCK